ncbi:hypothetical protein LBMAG52_29420 [Planctomycetia bacterium]|nr:hypothetical protein LBMAG52_29420 [Planctomycetia bacterium]
MVIEPKEVVEKPKAKWFSSVVSKDKFSQIRNGMSYRAVVAIIGASGEEQSSNHIDGVPGVIESIDTVMYSWRNRDGSNMNVMLQNDKVVSKAQFGLR